MTLGSQMILTEDVSIQKVFYTNPLELFDQMPAYWGPGEWSSHDSGSLASAIKITPLDLVSVHQLCTMWQYILSNSLTNSTWPVISAPVQEHLLRWQLGLLVSNPRKSVCSVPKSHVFRGLCHMMCETPDNEEPSVCTLWFPSLLALSSPAPLQPLSHLF